MNAVGARAQRAWRTDLLDVLFVCVESITWFLLIRVFATQAERGFLVSLADRVRLASATNEVGGRAGIERSLAAIEAAQQISYGPSFPLVVIAAFGGFFLIRGIMQLGLSGASGALVLLFASILGLNVIMHVAIAGDLRLWDSSTVVGFLVDPTPYFSERLDLVAFIANPDLSTQHGIALTVTMVGLGSIWFRFALAGRHTVTVERVTRSFGLGFAFALVAMVIAAVAEVRGLAPWTVLQFVGGILTLAVANHVRATAPSQGPVRPGPWLVAVGGTVGMLLVIAAILGLSVLLNVGALLDVIGNAALRVIEIVLIILVTPLYWLMDFLLRLILPAGMGSIFDNIGRIGFDLDQLRNQDGDNEGGLPGWVGNSAKFIAALVITWALYQLSRLLMGRRYRTDGTVEEVHSSASSSGGLGSFLRDLFPHGRHRDRDDWERRHPAYLLWRRAERDGEERGFSRLTGETAIEFAGRAEQMMAAPFPAVARVFDRLRYGKHEPLYESLAALDESLTSWEVATPATTELRERLAGATPLDPERDFALRIEAAKRAARGRARPGEDRPPPPPDVPT